MPASQQLLLFFAANSSCVAAMCLYWHAKAMFVSHKTRWHPSHAQRDKLISWCVHVWKTQNKRKKIIKKSTKILENKTNFRQDSSSKQLQIAVTKFEIINTNRHFQEFKYSKHTYEKMPPQHPTCNTSLLVLALPSAPLYWVSMVAHSLYRECSYIHFYLRTAWM